MTITMCVVCELGPIRCCVIVTDDEYCMADMGRTNSCGVLLH